MKKKTRRKLIYLFLLISVSLFIQGCINVDIKKSSNRALIPKKIDLRNDVVMRYTGEISVNNVDFFPSSFMIEAKGKIIYIDPVEVENPKPADYIFITHGHPDHFSLSDIKRLIKKDTIIICQNTVSKQLKDYDCKIIKPYETIYLGDIHLDCVPSYTKEPIFLWIIPHPKEDLNMGYIISVDGVRIYHAGDTDLIPEMGVVKDIDVAIVPISGGRLTMDSEQAAEAINRINPAIAIPVHYEREKNGLENFKKNIRKDIRVEIVE